MPPRPRGCLWDVGLNQWDVGLNQPAVPTSREPTVRGRCEQRLPFAQGDIAVNRRGDGELTAKAQQDPGAAAGQRMNEVVIDLRDRELEVVHRCVEHLRGPVEVLGDDKDGRGGDVVDVACLLYTSDAADE